LDFTIIEWLGGVKVEKLINEILSNPELAKILLQTDKNEKVYFGGSCKIIFCSEPANLKFVLCDVEIDNQDFAENEPVEISETQEKLIVNSDLTNNTNENLIDNFLKEIKNLKEELKRNNILLENIQTILQQKINMPGSLPCCIHCKEVIKDA